MRAAPTSRSSLNTHTSPLRISSRPSPACTSVEHTQRTSQSARAGNCLFVRSAVGRSFRCSCPNGPTLRHPTQPELEQERVRLRKYRAHCTLHPAFLTLTLPLRTDTGSRGQVCVWSPSSLTSLHLPSSLLRQLAISSRVVAYGLPAFTSCAPVESSTRAYRPSPRTASRALTLLLVLYHSVSPTRAHWPRCICISTPRSITQA